MWGLVVSDLPVVSLTVLWLVFLEGLLSADNALVLAMMVRHLPKPEQKRALRYGIWGAITFRMVAVLLARVLLDFWYLKVVGGLYLLYLAVAHVWSRRGDGSGGKALGFGRGFWTTVFWVEIADITFSIDSILAAVAMAEGMSHLNGNEKYGIVVTGGILGIITMRFVAVYFISLLERFRGLEAGAYGLVAWIGLKLVVSGLHHAGWVRFEINEWVFWIGMLVIVVVGLVYTPREKPRSGAEHSAMTGNVAGGEEKSDVG